MHAEVFSSNAWLYPESRSDCTEISVFTAKGSYATSQLILKGINGSVSWSVEFDKTDKITAELYELLPVNVNLNSYFYEPLDTAPRSNAELEALFTKRAPFEVYDPMKPILEESFTSNGFTPLYICFKIPHGISHGEYTGKICFSSDFKTVCVPVLIKIYNVSVPKKRSFNLTNWMSPRLKNFGCKPLDDKFFELYYNLATLGNRARQNCIYLTPNFFSCKYENGTYKYDFSGAQRYISKLLDMGYTRIESMHLTAVYSKFIQPIEGVDIHTEQGRKALGEFLKQYYSFICENGYKDIIIQHIGDEPKDEGAEAYRSLANLFKEYMPDIPIIDAILTPDVCDVVDIPVPITRLYQLKKAEYDLLMKDSKEIWIYTCCWPTAPYLNRFLDMPLLSARLLHWLNFKLNINGYLHWGFCSIAENQNVYTEPSIAFKYMGVPESDQFLPAGDCSIVYPYKNGFIGSVRLEMMRAGVEDYELFRLLETKSPETAANIVNSAIDSDWCSKVDNEQFLRLQKILLEALEE